MLARVLMDFFLVNGRTAEAFDLNEDAELARHFPAHTTVATVAGIKGQMALFDRLVSADGAAKIVDVGNPTMAAFFDVVRETGFVEEARRRAIAPVILFMASDEAASADVYERLRAMLPGAVIVPVYNDHAGKPAQRGRYASGGIAGHTASLPIRLPALAPGFHRYIDKVPFSFTRIGTGAIPMDAEFELRRWMRRITVEFREMELRILLANLQDSLQNPA